MRPAMKGRTSKKIRAPQLSRGHQVCVSCFHETTVVPAIRCAACDREVCTLCVVLIAAFREQLCPECAAELASAASAPAEPPPKRKGRKP
jgi:hypothetical protein